MSFSRRILGLGSLVALVVAAACSSSGGTSSQGGDAGPNGSSGSGNDMDQDGGNSANGNGDAGPGNSDTPDADTQAPDEPSCDTVGTGTPTWTMTALDIPELMVVDLEYDPFGSSVIGFSGVAYGNGLFVAPVNGSNEEVYRWATSSNGVDWEAHSRPVVETGKTYTTSRIHFLNGKFVYFTELFGVGAFVNTSSNGMDWTSTLIGTGRAVFADFTASSTTTVAVGGSGDMRSSMDLQSFTPRTTGEGLFSYLAIAFGNGRFVASTNGDGQVFGSDNGEDWDLLDDVGTAGGVFMEYGNNVFVANGQGQTLWTSPDGITFTPQTPVGIIGAPPRFAGGRFMSWRTKGFSFPPEGVISVISMDGIEWTEWGEAAGFSDVEPGPQNAAPYSIADTAFGNCTYVMAGLFATRKLDPERLTYQPLVITAPAAVATP